MFDKNKLKDQITDLEDEITTLKAACSSAYCLVCHVQSLVREHPNDDKGYQSALYLVEHQIAEFLMHYKKTDQGAPLAKQEAEFIARYEERTKASQ